MSVFRNRFDCLRNEKGVKPLSVIKYLFSTGVMVLYKPPFPAYRWGYVDTDPYPDPDCDPE